MEDIRKLAVETDTAIAGLYQELQSVEIQIDRVSYGIHVIAKSERVARISSDFARSVEEAIEAGNPEDSQYPQEEFDKRVNEYIKFKNEKNEINEKIAKLDAVYRQYFWNRAFLVIGGHVHSSRSCSTCYDSTQFAWLPQYSGGSEEEIVEDAGEEACTICYPSAPADVLNRPSRIVTQDKIEREQAKREREEAKKKRDAKKLASAVTADGSPLVVTDGSYKSVYSRENGFQQTENFRLEEIKTERSAKIWYVEQRENIQFRKALSNEGRVAVAESCEKIVYALAEKHGVEPEEIRNVLEIKVAKRVKEREKWDTKIA